MIFVSFFFRVPYIHVLLCGAFHRWAWTRGRFAAIKFGLCNWAQPRLGQDYYVHQKQLGNSSLLRGMATARSGCYLYACCSNLQQNGTVKIVTDQVVNAVRSAAIVAGVWIQRMRGLLPKLRHTQTHDVAKEPPGNMGLYVHRNH